MRLLFLLAMTFLLSILSCSKKNNNPEENFCDLRVANVEIYLGSNYDISFQWTPSGAAAYNIQFGLDGFILGTGEIVQVNTAMATLSLPGSGNYDFYFQAVCLNGGFGDYGKWFATIYEPCEREFLVFASEVGATYAELSWQNRGGVEGFEIEYGENPFPVGNGIFLNTQESNIVIENLKPLTTYYAIVRAKCSPSVYGYSHGRQFTTTD